MDVAPFAVVHLVYYFVGGEYTKSRVRDAARKMVNRLNITGPVDIQFVAKGTDIMCIDTNVRTSRSFPFVSKTKGFDFIAATTRAMVGVGTKYMDLPKRHSCILCSNQVMVGAGTEYIEYPQGTHVFFARKHGLGPILLGVDGFDRGSGLR